MGEVWDLSDIHDPTIQKNKSFNCTQELNIWNNKAVTQKTGYTNSLVQTY